MERIGNRVGADVVQPAMNVRLSTLIAPTLIALVAVSACGGDEAATVSRPAGTTTPTLAPTISPTTTPSTTPSTTPTGPPVDTALRYDPAGHRAALDEARARWAERGAEAYRLTVTPVCFCPRSQAVADVVGGHVVRRTGEFGARSVEEWFDEIDAAIGTAVDVRVTYDDDVGHPTSLYVDVSEIMADEEFGFELIELAPEPHPIEAFVSDAYGCGFGFWAASPDQTAAVTIGIPIGDDVDGEPEPGTYDFTVLVGEIRFGTDLMANWCDDVIEEDEPTPEIDETWRIVGGTLEYTVAEGPGASVATATLIGIVARDGDGVEHALGDATMINRAWGVVAG